jgi:hypothetical protein
MRMNLPLTIAIEKAIQGTKPRTAKRMKALATVRWVLATDDGRFVAVDDRAEVHLVLERTQANVYDARDNEALKHRFMEALLKVRLNVVLLDAPPVDSRN